MKYILRAQKYYSNTTTAVVDIIRCTSRGKDFLLIVVLPVRILFLLLIHLFIYLFIYLIYFCIYFILFFYLFKSIIFYKLRDITTSDFVLILPRLWSSVSDRKRGREHSLRTGRLFFKTERFENSQNFDRGRFCI